jgi:hypothetical protein
VIAGHLCESGDMFTQGEGGIVQSRLLPKLTVGDFLIFHDVGAYGESFNTHKNATINSHINSHHRLFNVIKLQLMATHTRNSLQQQRVETHQTEADNPRLNAVGAIVKFQMIFLLLFSTLWTQTEREPPRFIFGAISSARRT